MDSDISEKSIFQLPICALLNIRLPFTFWSKLFAFWTFQDIYGMVSVDEEDVPFSTIIYPADAKGMVSFG